MLTNLVLLALVLITMIPFIHNTLQNTNDQMTDNLHSIISNTVLDLERTISNFEDNIFLKTNDVIDRARFVWEKDQSSKGYYAIRNASEYLNQMVSVSSAIKDVLISFPEKEIIINKSGAFDSVESFNRYYAMILPYNELFSYSNPSVVSAHYIASRYLFNGYETGEEVFAYCFNKVMMRKYDVCLLLRTEEFMGAEILQAIGAGGCAVLSDDMGTVIKQIGDIPTDLHGSLAECADAYTYITVTHSSKDNHLILQARMPKMLSSRALARIIPILVACLAAAIISGFIFSAISARYHAKPVQNLLAKLKEYSSQAEHSETQIKMLQRSISELQNETDLFEKKMENYRLKRREATVARLFTAYGDQNDDDEYGREMFSTLPMPFFVAYGKVTDLPIGSEFRDEIGMLSLESIRAELPEKSLVYSPNPNSVAVLLDAQSDRHIVDRLKELENIQWSFSRIYESPKLVSLALDDARISLSKRETPGNIVSFQNLYRLYQCLISGDQEHACANVREFFSGANIDNIKYIYDSIRNMIYLTAYEYDQVIQDPSFKPIVHFDKHNSFDELLRLLTNGVENFCMIINAQKKSKNENRKKLVFDFIHANYTNSDLYAGCIAERVGLSEKYLYNYVKEQTGLSLGDYLMKLRMERTAEILLETDTPVKDIYAMVGFNSDNSFYKAFKRTFGITPSQYRELHRTK